MVYCKLLFFLVFEKFEMATPMNGTDDIHRVQRRKETVKNYDELETFHGSLMKMASTWRKLFFHEKSPTNNANAIFSHFNFSENNCASVGNHWHLIFDETNIDLYPLRRSKRRKTFVCSKLSKRNAFSISIDNANFSFRELFWCNRKLRAAYICFDETCHDNGMKCLQIH